MGKYRKRPVEIDAIQFNGINQSQICEFAGDVTIDWDSVHIHTLEGTMRADVGDWIVKGVKGEFYPCKPDIFEATYEAV